MRVVFDHTVAQKCQAMKKCSVFPGTAPWCVWLFWSRPARLCSGIRLKGIHSNTQIINLQWCAVCYMTMFDDKLCVRKKKKLNVSSKAAIWSVDSWASWAKWGNSHEELTLDNMGDHQRGTAVIAGQTSAGKILFDLEGKQVPGHKHKQLSQIQQGRCGGGFRR